MEITKKAATQEKIIYAIGCFLLFLLPLIQYLQMKASGEGTAHNLYRSWVLLLPYVGLFFVSDRWLIPRFLTLRKFRAYVVASVLMVIIFGLAMSFIQVIIPMEHQHNKNQELQFRRFEDSRWDKASESERKAHRKSFFDKQRNKDRRNRLGAELPFLAPFPVSPGLGHILMSLLILGMNISIKGIFRNIALEKDKRERDEAMLRSELNYLKYQINPHFFMNTLNNIHALIDIDSEEAKQTIIDFSKMMRYVLYETNEGFSFLKDDIDFMKNYVRLMKLKYTDNVKIEFTVENIKQSAKVPSLLLVGFIENAIKYGTDAQKESLITIHIECIEGSLVMNVQNSCNAKRTLAPDHQGIGLVNTRKRLDLIYKDKYELKIKDENNLYNVLLKLPIC